MLWSENGYEVITTGDGSPTLRSLQFEKGDGEREMMHHSGGAYSETQMIYGTALRKLLLLREKSLSSDFISEDLLKVESKVVSIKPQLRRNSPLAILSIGLGLGYNELLVAHELSTRKLVLNDLKDINDDEFSLKTCKAFKKNESIKQLEKKDSEFFLENSSQIEITMDSFESDSFLKENFLDFIDTYLFQFTELQTREAVMEVNSGWREMPLNKDENEIKETYKKLLNCFSPSFDEQKEILYLLRIMKHNNLWKIHNALSETTEFTTKYKLIFYDAFSSKTNPELWNEDFLYNFLMKTSSDDCIFTSYACTGALKRSLKKAGFEIYPQIGFQNKRNSTFALKVNRND